MQKVLSGLLMACWLLGCSSSATVKGPEVASTGPAKSDKPAQVAADPGKSDPNATARPDTGERPMDHPRCPLPGHIHQIAGGERCPDQVGRRE